MKTIINENDLLKIYDESAIHLWVFNNIIYQKKIKKPLLIFKIITFIPIIYMTIMGLHNFIILGMFYTIGWALSIYFAFLLIVNPYAKRRILKIGIKSDNNIFKHWHNEEVKKIRVDWFVLALNKKFNDMITNINDDDLSFLNEYSKNMSEKYKKELNIGFRLIQLLLPLALSFGYAFYINQNDKLSWTFSVLLCFLIIWLFMKFIEEIYEDYANTKSRKFKAISELFQTIRLNKTLEEN